MRKNHGTGHPVGCWIRILEPIRLNILNGNLNSRHIWWATTKKNTSVISVLIETQTPEILEHTNANTVSTKDLSLCNVAKDSSGCNKGIDVDILLQMNVKRIMVNYVQITRINVILTHSVSYCFFTFCHLPISTLLLFRLT